MTRDRIPLRGMCARGRERPRRDGASRGDAARAYGLGILALLCGLGSATQAAEPVAAEVYRPEYHSCAAYFFLSARVHPIARYEELYSAGEFALNQAILAFGREEAEKRMGTESSAMMDEIESDWRLIERLDRKYGGACEALLRDARFDIR